MRDVPGACVERLPALFGPRMIIRLLLGGPEGPEPALGTSLDQSILCQEHRHLAQAGPLAGLHCPMVAVPRVSPGPPGEPQPASSGCSVQGRPDVH